MEKFSAKHTFEEIRNFLAGRFMGATRDEFLLEEIVKLIFCKYELGSTNTTDIEEVELSKLYRETFKNVINENEETSGMVPFLTSIQPTWSSLPLLPD